MSDVAAVVTQPDRPRGRGLEISSTPVKTRASELGLRVIQPVKVRTPELARDLGDLFADVAVVAAYGRILPRGLLDAPRLGCVNVHASLLPRWRGAAPVAWAMKNGDRETGVCLMKMDEGLDTGPVLATVRTAIADDDTAGGVLDRLSLLGAELLTRSLPLYVEGKLVAVPQDAAAATLAPMLDKENGRIDWSEPARRVCDHVRAMSPWPGAFTTLRMDDHHARLKVHRARVAAWSDQSARPGGVLQADALGLVVACGEGAVAIDELQIEGRPRLTCGQFLAGRRIPVGTCLGEEVPRNAR